jgi:hypothetical protein
MALSRLAKRFREQEPTTTTTTVTQKKSSEKTGKKAPAAKPAPAAPVSAAPAPAPEPAAPPEPPKPGKRQQEKVKRPKFVYVPAKTERKAPAAPTLPVGPRSNKLAARLMTQNLALPPEDEPGRGPTLPGFGRV